MEFNDLDFLLLLVSFSSYITIKFIVESGWILGIIISILSYLALKKTCRIRHSLYLYFILLFTSRRDQEWLQSKFPLSLNSNKSSIKKEILTDKTFKDALNKTVEVVWPFIACFVEEEIRKKIELINSYMNDSRMKPLTQYLTDFKAKEINLGTNPPVIRTLNFFSSKESKNLIYEVEFTYISNGLFKLHTHIKPICIENLKVKGCIRIELGSLLSFPPFIEDIKLYMPELPQLHFTVSNTPDKIEDLARIISLEKVSDVMVMPNHIQVCLSRTSSIEKNMPAGVIFLHVIEAENLPNTESFTFSDPYCVVRLGDRKAVTKTIRSNLNPVWNFATQIICFNDPSKGGLDVSFSIYDEDLIHEVFHDFLFSSKMNIRCIRDQKFVEEWLENSAENEIQSSKEVTYTGRLHIQAIWQQLSSDKSLLNKEGVMLKDNMESKTNFETNLESVQCSNFEEANLSDSNETLEMDKIDGFLFHKKKKNSKISLFKSIFIVWIDSAVKLEPIWEDFQIQLEICDKIEKTSFVSRNKWEEWCWKRTFVFSCSENLEEELQIRIISRSKGKCVGHLAFQIDSIIEQPNLNLGPKQLYFKDKNQICLKSSINMSFALRVLEPMCDEYITKIEEAQRNANEKRASSSKSKISNPSNEDEQREKILHQKQDKNKTEEGKNETNNDNEKNMEYLTKQVIADETDADTLTKTYSRSFLRKSSTNSQEDKGKDTRWIKLWKNSSKTATIVSSIKK